MFGIIKRDIFGKFKFANIMFTETVIERFVIHFHNSVLFIKLCKIVEGFHCKKSQKYPQRRQ